MTPPLQSLNRLLLTATKSFANRQSNKSRKLKMNINKQWPSVMPDDKLANKS
jgi:hypothetical protein